MACQSNLFSFHSRLPYILITVMGQAVSPFICFSVNPHHWTVLGNEIECAELCGLTAVIHVGNKM